MPDFVTFPALIILCAGIGHVVKAWTKIPNTRIPSIVFAAGVLLGIAALYIVPGFPASDPINAAAVGGASGLASTGAVELWRRAGKKAAQ